MRAPLNLASRPFRNERLPRVLMGLAWTTALALTLGHGLLAYSLLPHKTSERHAEATRLENKLRRTAGRVAAGKTDVSPDNLRLWSALKAIVDRRTFSWTTLLADLEPVVPLDVRVVSIIPGQSEGRTQLKLEALAQRPEGTLELLRALDARPQFSLVYPMNVSEDQGLRRTSYAMLYEPQAAAAVSATSGVEAAVAQEQP